MTFDLDVRHAHLENGLRLVAVENAAHPSVCIRLTARGGPAAEPCERAGVAELATRALLIRSQRFTPPELDDFLDLHGIALSRAVNRHACDIVLRCPAESLEPSLELLADLVQYPRFVDREVALMTRQVVSLIAQQELDSRGAASIRLRQLAYPRWHAYARQPHGLASTVPCITAQDLEGFVRSHVRPGNTLVSVAGDAPFDSVLDITSRCFGNWSDSGQDSEPPIARAPRPRAIRDHVTTAGSGQAELIVGGPTVGCDEPGYRALMLGTLILGQMGLGGRLGMRIREAEGLAYECYASLEDVPIGALWTARASVHPADVDRAACLIGDEIRRLRTEPVTDAELAACKSACLGGMRLAGETNAGLASMLQTTTLDGLDLDWAVRLADEIRHVTPRDIQSAAQTWLNEDHLLVVSAGPPP